MSTICKKGEPLEECEKKLLQRAIKESDEKQKNKLLTEEVLQIVDILKQFMIKKRVICYGGTAINNILPKEAQFYQENELPDFDFYSTHPLEDAKTLVDIYAKKGFREVEAKSGTHVGTFKVYVNFIPIADITFLEHQIFHCLAKEAIVINGIQYCPPNYLRMSMFLELSRPSGDVSRWEKVFSRLFLLNLFYPLVGTSSLLTIPKPDVSINHSEILDYLVTYDVLFIGGYAFSLITGITDFSCPGYYDIISDKHMTTEAIVQHFHPTSVKRREAIGTIPRCTILKIPLSSLKKVGTKHITLTIYDADTCYGYNEYLLPLDENNFQRTIKLATIDTLLSIYLAFVYTTIYDRQHYLWMASVLFELEQKNRKAKSGIMRRFSTQCYGKEESIYDIREEKAKKKREFMDRGLKKTSKEYEWYFLHYQPRTVMMKLKKYHKMHHHTIINNNKKILRYTRRKKGNYLF